MEYTLSSLFEKLQADKNLLMFVSAVFILFAGFLLAVVAGSIVKRFLQKIAFARNLAKVLPEDASSCVFRIEKWIPRCIFFLVVFILLFFTLEMLGFSNAGGPVRDLLTKILSYGANLAGAGTLILCAWLAASAVRYLSHMAMNALSLDEKFSGLLGKASEEKTVLEEHFSISSAVSELLYWFVILFFLPGILGALKLEKLLLPFQKMLEKLFLYLPDLVTGLLLLGAGILFAMILRKAAEAFLNAGRFDSLMKRAGCSGKAAGFIGRIVFITVMIPVLAAVFEVLKITVFSSVLGKITEKILNSGTVLAGCALLLCVSYIGGVILSGYLQKLLEKCRFENLFSGLVSASAMEKHLPLRIAGKTVLVLVMLLAFSAVCDAAGFQNVAEKTSLLLVFAGKLLLGIGIFLAGNVLSKFVRHTLEGNPLLAQTARFGILFFAGAFALNVLGIADGVIVGAFLIVLGAVALALALAFGLGGRALAEEKLIRWKEKLEEEKKK